MDNPSERIESNEEAWPFVMGDLNQELSANDPESLLAANDGYDDPGEPSGDRESRYPKPPLPKNGMETG